MAECCFQITYHILATIIRTTFHIHHGSSNTRRAQSKEGVKNVQDKKNKNELKQKKVATSQLCLLRGANVSGWCCWCCIKSYSTLLGDTIVDRQGL